MKLGKSSLIIIIAGVILVGVLFLGYNLFQQYGTQQDLRTNLALAKQKLNSVNTDKLEVQANNLTLAAAQSEAQIQALKTQLSFNQDGIDVIDSLLANAELCKVNILEMTSPGLSTETVTQSHFQTIPISFKVAGTVENIANFIYSMSTVFPTGVLRSTQLSIDTPPLTVAVSPEPAPDTTNGTAQIPVDISAASGPTKATAALSLVIYSYTGE